MSDKFTVRSRIREYTVEFTDHLKALEKCAGEGAFLVLDEKVGELYGGKMKEFFAPEKILMVHADEESKTLRGCQGLIKELIERGIRRNNKLVAVGGGVIEDIAGFMSTVIFRGIEWVFIPTTLLAQADSCIGSKSSINLGRYKNMLGSFYPPSNVYIDVEFLKTLPESEIKSGIGEVLHFYLIAGEEELAGRMMSEYDAILADPGKMKDYILPSLLIKKSVIEVDELDKNERNIFNYGHTFGHAIETVTSYGINHGQAVTMGMDMANYISMKKGYIKEEVFDRLHGILARNMPDFALSEESSDGYFKALSKDKKNVGADLGCILTKGPGKMFKELVPMNRVFKDDIFEYFGRRTPDR